LAKLCNRKSNVFIILYADDILLLAPSVCEFDNLFKISERELKLLDMTTNFKEIVLYSHWTFHIPHLFIDITKYNHSINEQNIM